MNTKPVQIFLLEDNKDLGFTLKDKFKESGFIVHWFENLNSAYQFKSFNDIDLFVLDVGLSDGTGFDFAAWIKEKKLIQPVIFLTAMGEPEHRLKGYELGAEEYIPKPFLFKELEIRINHVLENHSKSEIYTLPKLTIDFAAMTFKWADGSIVFPQSKDLQILKILVFKSPQVVSRDEILNQVWGLEEFPTERTVDNSIVRLRQILNEYQTYLKSVRGQGYQWIVT